MLLGSICLASREKEATGRVEATFKEGFLTRAATWSMFRAANVQIAAKCPIDATYSIVSLEGLHSRLADSAALPCQKPGSPVSFCVEEDHMLHATNRLHTSYAQINRVFYATALEHLTSAR